MFAGILVVGAISSQSFARPPSPLLMYLSKLVLWTRIHSHFAWCPKSVILGSAVHAAMSTGSLCWGRICVVEVGVVAKRRPAADRRTRSTLVSKMPSWWRALLIKDVMSSTAFGRRMASGGVA